MMMVMTMTDRSLQQAVLDELNWQPNVNAANIGVTAKDGVVTLTGHVGSYAEKWAAERAAGRVFGVKAVAEELEVRYPFEKKEDDADIAQGAPGSLLGYPSSQGQSEGQGREGRGDPFG
jgi:hypothetical protein